MSMCNSLENLVLNTLRGTSMAWPNVYVKLHTSSPGENGTSGAFSDQSRKIVTFSAASGGTITSNVDVSWPSLTAAGTITHLSLWSAASGGTALWYGQLTTPRAVEVGDALIVPSGSLILTVA